MTSQGSYSLPTSVLAKRALVISFAMLSSVVVDCSALLAQGNQVIRTAHSRERTREIIDDYSNSIGSDGGFDTPRHPDRRNLNGQGQVDVKSIRPLIRAFSDSMTQLTYALNDQTSQLPGARQIYAEALRLSGAAVGINKRSEKYGVDGAMLDDLQQLDADWRELAYQMENLRGLSGDSRALVDDINDADHKIRQAIGMQPQLDRRQLNLKVAGLAADLENLQEDIASELGNSHDSQTYRRSISRVRQAVLSLVATLRDDRSDTASIVDDYKQFESMWAPLAGKLSAEEDRYIERGIQRVAMSSGEIHRLLLLPQKVDQSQSAYLAKSLKKDIDEFFERTPLILVMHLPNSKLALPVADQFYATCARFVEVVSHSQDQAEIQDSFRKIEQAERAFLDVYRDVDSDRAVAVLSRISRTVGALRSSLHIHRDDFDSQTASDLAASIENCTEQIASVAKRWLQQDNQPFANDCLQETAELADVAATLHDNIMDGKRPSELKEGMIDIYERWRRVYGYLIKCQSEDRPTLGRLSTALTPAIVDLRALILQ